MNHHFILKSFISFHSIILIIQISFSFLMLNFNFFTSCFEKMIHFEQVLYQDPNLLTNVYTVFLNSFNYYNFKRYFVCNNFKLYLDLLHSINKIFMILLNSQIILANNKQQILQEEFDLIITLGLIFLLFFIFFYIRLFLDHTHHQFFYQFLKDFYYYPEIILILVLYELFISLFFFYLIFD